MRILLSTVVMLTLPLMGAESDLDKLIELDLDELVKVEIDSVYGVSKMKQRTVDAPANVTVISKEEIKRNNYRSLTEAVSSQSGFYTTYDRNYEYLGVRGFASPGDYSTKILVLIDGQRINDNLYSSSPIGTGFPLDMDMIDHIEVIRGPGSALYGTSALFAVINVIPKSSKDFKNGEVALTLGNYGTDKERATFAHEFEDNSTILLSATRYHSDGDDSLYYKEFDDPSTNNGYAENVDSDDAYKLYMKYKSGNFSLESLYVKREKDVPTAAWETVFNKAINSIDERGYIRAKYTKKLSEELNLSTNVAYNYYDYTGEYLYEDDGIVTSYDRNPSSWLDANIDLTYHQNDQLQWLVGVAGMYSIEEKIIYYYDGDNYIDRDEPIDNYAAYVQALYKLNEKLTLNMGLRYDYYESFGSHLSPRIAAIYALSDNSSLKFIYGSAFRAPNGYERNYGDGYYQKGNPDLREETIENFEIIWEQHFEKNHFLTINGFYYKMNDLITQVEDPIDYLLVFENVDEAESKGVEIAYTVGFGKGIQTSYNYTYQYATNSESNKGLLNSPRHLANAKASLPFLDKYRTSLSLQYVGQKKGYDGDMIDDYVLTNISVQGDNIVEDLELSATVYNLFDTEYTHVAGKEHTQPEIGQDGLSFRVQAVYKF